VRTDFGAGCFFAAATAGPAVGAAVGGRGGDAVVPGSGVMMLTAGVEAAVGNSALVGLPVGSDGGRAATGAIAGALHNGS